MDILPPSHLPYDVLDFMQTTDLVLDDIETLTFDFDAGVPLFFEGSEDPQGPDETASRREAFEKSPW
ncbi:hypothetical protein SLS58_000795 [Diplodia intermedia]|uniref:Uncharacterized protein n=1 Tax=Diplodia intermedia TaxID=856260 RepID=A0ABR3U3K5_9PEZI